MAKSPKDTIALCRSRMVDPAAVEAKLAFRLILTCCARLWLCAGQQGHDTRALQAYLGHKNIQHTVRYTELSSDRFKEFWDD